MRYITACQCGRWYIETWKKDEPDNVRLIPYRCRSWRHEGECRLWNGAQMFCRVRDAILSLRNWTLLTLTYAQRGRELNAARFREAKEQWAKLRKRLIYDYEGIKYIQTWEVHKSGWPHVHIALSNSELYALCEYDGASNFANLIRHHATSVGFGGRGEITPLRSTGAVAGYLSKLARELVDGSVKSQIPVNAPPHFRRLRASRGLLPKVLRNEDYTGRMLEMKDNGELVPLKKRKSGVSA